MERKVFICKCGSVEHQVSIAYDEEEKRFYIHPHLYNSHNIFKRLVIGIKYILGYKCKYGAWDEIIINEEDLNNYLK